MQVSSVVASPRFIRLGCGCRMTTSLSRDQRSEPHFSLSKYEFSFLAFDMVV